MRPVLLLSFSSLALHLSAQPPTIGGGTCSSATLTKNYAFSLTGRQVTSSGNFTSVFQGNGMASFDGLSKVTITLTADSPASVGTPISWSGTYSMQANCVGLITIASGGSATFNVAAYDNGADFLVTGNDAIYSYNGNGNSQPTTSCSTGTFSGVYTLNGSGFGMKNGSVSGAGDATGLLQFDGQGNLTANVALSSVGPTLSQTTFSGPYSVSSNCMGSANITDAKGNMVVMTFSVFTATSVASTDFYTTLAQSGKVIILGQAHAAYGQPTPSAANRESAQKLRYAYLKK